MSFDLKETGTYSGPVPVSLIMPCLNEAQHIETCIASLLTGDYPAELLEVLVLDGLSQDGTCDILMRMTETWPQIKVIDNPGASKPKALNMGIAAASHDLVMRMDCHATYPANYISELVRCLHVYEADNVGGVRLNRTRGETPVAKALATVLTHKFGVGDAKHYTGTTDPMQSDIIFLFCARKALFDDVGGFDERLLRGQDREFNLRMTRLGKKMILCPSTHSIYYTRDRLVPFAKWAFIGGKTPFDISRILGTSLVSWRNLVPPVFVGGLVGSVLLGLIASGFFWITCVILTLYFGVALAITLRQPSTDLPAPAKVLLPFCFFIWHAAYGVGAIRGGFQWGLNILRGRTGS